MKSSWLLWLIVAIIIYRQIVPLANLVKDFPLNDFSVYIDGTKASLNRQNPYAIKFFDRYNYPPAATLFFIPLAFLPINLSELIFIIASIASVWFSVSWTLAIINWKPSRPIKWLIFALSLKMFPVKLTLALGQINLIILMLIVGSFYFCESLVLHRKAEPFQILSGILLGLAIVLKLTPAPILIYFLIRNKWKVIKWSTVTIAVLTAAGGIVFGWDLTRYYFVSVVPGLIGEVTRETVNASYMNQSVTALMARFGIFGNLNSAIRLGTSLAAGIIIINIIRVIKDEEIIKKFRSFWSYTVIVMLILPVFVWQHHLAILVPSWLIIVYRAIRTKSWQWWVIAAATYLLLNFHIEDGNLVPELPVILSSHFLFTSVFVGLTGFMAGFGPKLNQKSDLPK